jgi:hypothetical protein
MPYYKAQLKSNGDRKPPGFIPLLTGNTSEKLFPTRTLVYVSTTHIFISLTGFMGIPYSMRRLYKASLLTESQAFLKSVES